MGDVKPALHQSNARELSDTNELYIIGLVYPALTLENFILTMVSLSKPQNCVSTGLATALIYSPNDVIEGIYFGIKKCYVLAKHM